MTERVTDSLLPVLLYSCFELISRILIFEQKMTKVNVITRRKLILFNALKQFFVWKNEKVERNNFNFVCLQKQIFLIR